MSLGAVSLKPHNQYTKTNAIKAQSFGAKREPDDLKNRTAAGIAISVGTTAALLIAGYMFRGKILNLPVFKGIKTFFNGLPGKANQAKEKIAATAKNIGEKASGLKDDVAQKAKKVGEKAYETSKSFIQETVEKAQETIKKLHK